jgi:hypothetical protein
MKGHDNIRIGSNLDEHLREGGRVHNFPHRKNRSPQAIWETPAPGHASHGIHLWRTPPDPFNLGVHSNDSRAIHIR